MSLEKNPLVLYFAKHQLIIGVLAKEERQLEDGFVSIHYYETATSMFSFVPKRAKIIENVREADITKLNRVKLDDKTDVDAYVIIPKDSVFTQVIGDVQTKLDSAQKKILELESQATQLRGQLRLSNSSAAEQVAAANQLISKKKDEQQENDFTTFGGMR